MSSALGACCLPNSRNAVQVGGISRIWGDYGKIAGGSDLTGAYPEGILEQMADAVGAAKFKGAEMPEAVQRKAIQSRTTATQKEASELKKDRQPKREIDKRK